MKEGTIARLAVYLGYTCEVALEFMQDVSIPLPDINFLGNHIAKVE